MGYADFERYANDRVEDLLETYANARLEATPAALARIRANVMRQAAASARVQAAVDSVVPASGHAAAQRRLGWVRGPVLRRAYSVGFAASLAMGIGAAVLAAPPGSPFYNARLVIETALLPSQVDARLAAYEEHLTERLREAEVAAVAGDPDALSAALAAYESDVAAALESAGDDPELLAHLEAMLAKHTAVLEALEARVPELASVDKAIASSQKAIEKIKEKAANGGTGGGGDGGNGGPGGNGGNGGNGGPGSRPTNAPNEPPDGPPNGTQGGDQGNDQGDHDSQ
jgi:hypothetical protein